MREVNRSPAAAGGGSDGGRLDTLEVGLMAVDEGCQEQSAGMNYSVDPRGMVVRIPMGSCCGRRRRAEGALR